MKSLQPVNTKSTFDVITAALSRDDELRQRVAVWLAQQRPAPRATRVAPHRRRAKRMAYTFDQIATRRLMIAADQPVDVIVKAMKAGFVAEGKPPTAVQVRRIRALVHTERSEFRRTGGFTSFPRELAKQWRK